MAAEIVGIPGLRVLSATHNEEGVLRVLVETGVSLASCYVCGVVATAHGRRVRVLHDVPFGHRGVRLAWRQRVWRCEQERCPVRTWTENPTWPGRGRC